MRTIKGVRWAKPCPRPKGIPLSRPRGTKKLGLLYERALAASLPAWSHGQWLEFEDRSGHGYCQPDLLRVTPIWAWVIEVKLSWTEEALAQLENYRQVVELAFDRPMMGLTACKYLRPGIAAVVADSLHGAQSLALLDQPVVWHCLDAKRPLLAAA